MIYGNFNFLNGMRDFLYKQNFKCYIYKTKTTYMLRINIQKDVLKFLSLLYKDSDGFRLLRKYCKYKEYIGNEFIIS